MFKTRVLSSIVGLALLFAVVFLGREVMAAAVFLISLISVREFYGAFKEVGIKPVKPVGYLSCIIVLIAGFLPEIKRIYTGSESLTAPLFFLVLLVLSSVLVFKFGYYNINDIAVTLFGVLYVPFLFSFLLLTRNMENGYYLMWLIFIGAWGTDTFAYLTGMLIGRTKILPAVSPKKSLEGMVGGIVFCTAAVIAYGYYLNTLMNPVPLHHFILIGLLLSTISQLGDWTASAVKRFTKIKDFGNIMPGHGGVLDRFDSILFIAPVVYFYLSLVLGYI